MVQRDYKLLWIVGSVLVATWASLVYAAYSMGLIFG